MMLSIRLEIAGGSCLAALGLGHGPRAFTATGLTSVTGHDLPRPQALPRSRATSIHGLTPCFVFRCMFQCQHLRWWRIRNCQGIVSSEPCQKKSPDKGCLVLRLMCMPLVLRNYSACFTVSAPHDFSSAPDLSFRTS